MSKWIHADTFYVTHTQTVSIYFPQEALLTNKYCICIYKYMNDYWSVHYGLLLSITFLLLPFKLPHYSHAITKLGYKVCFLYCSLM